MQNHNTGANIDVSGRVCRANNAAANEPVPRSVWQPGVVQRLADYIRYVREVDFKPDQHNVACQSAVNHQCPRHIERTCDCSSDACADDDGDGSSFYNGGNSGKPESQRSTNGCQHCGSKHEFVCLGSSKECCHDAPTGAGRGAAETAKPC